MRVRRALPYSTVEVVVMRPVEGTADGEGKNGKLEKITIPVKMQTVKNDSVSS